MALLYLPFPPTVNTYWRGVRNLGRVLISAKGRQYREDVTRHLRGCGLHYTSEVAIEVTYFPPDRRKRDLDNLPKGLLDAIVAAGVLADDSLIVDSRSRWGAVTPGGAALVTIWETELRRHELSDFIGSSVRFGRFVPGG